MHHSSCALWLKYGVLANEVTVVLVNAVGAILFFIYFVIFWLFTVNTSAIYRQFFACITILGLTLSYTDYYEIDRKEAVEVVGEFGLLLDNSLNKDRLSKVIHV